MNKRIEELQIKKNTQVLSEAEEIELTNLLAQGVNGSTEEVVGTPLAPVEAEVVESTVPVEEVVAPVEGEVSQEPAATEEQPVQDTEKVEEPVS